MSTPTQDFTLLARIARLEALESIRRLIHDVSQSFDRRELDRFLSNWHPDPRWLVAPGYEAVGLDALRGIAETSWTTMKSVHHWTCNEIIDVDGDQATGVVEVISLAQSHDGIWHQGGATYHDQYVKVAGAWKLKTRRARIHAIMSLVEAPGAHPWGNLKSDS